ncbi:hypothetical protein, partial [Pseudoalteromonas sp. S981]|uniref:hypothetical protein n=1 Tax=Pseudoalteromonas sp. S981 TaxID=579569 RepID=UPI00110CFFB6
QASVEYSHVPLHTLQQLAGMNAGLFDTLVIFENYPVDAIQTQTGAALALKVTNVEGYEGTNYAITLKAHIEASLSIGCEVQGVIFDDAALESMLGHL